MALIVETGAGVRGADSYNDLTFILSYLTARARNTENTWDTRTVDVQEAAARASTDYMDGRFGCRLKGRRQFTLEGAAAVGGVDVTSNPADGDTVTISTSTYTFRTTVLAPFEVAIGTTTADTAANLLALLAGSADIRTPALVGLSGAIEVGTPSLISLTLANDSELGNLTPLTQSAAALTLTAFSGGLDAGDQPREFPRTGLYLPDGGLVVGVPLLWRQAHAEYAVRAVAASLEADPTPLPAGSGPVTLDRRKVDDAVEKEIRYASPADGITSADIDPYPLADRMVKDFLFTGGTSFR